MTTVLINEYRGISTKMPRSKHYCADCDTHFGGPPENETPTEHADRVHDGYLFRGIENGDKQDYQGRVGYE